MQEKYERVLFDGSLKNRRKTVNKMCKVMNSWEIALMDINNADWLH